MQHRRAAGPGFQQIPSGRRGRRTLTFLVGAQLGLAWALLGPLAGQARADEDQRSLADLMAAARAQTSAHVEANRNDLERFRALRELQAQATYQASDWSDFQTSSQPLAETARADGLGEFGQADFQGVGKAAPLQTASVLPPLEAAPEPAVRPEPAPEPEPQAPTSEAAPAVVREQPSGMTLAALIDGLAATEPRPEPVSEPVVAVLPEPRPVLAAEAAPPLAPEPAVLPEPEPRPAEAGEPVVALAPEVSETPELAPDPLAGQSFEERPLGLTLAAVVAGQAQEAEAPGPVAGPAPEASPEAPPQESGFRIGLKNLLAHLWSGDQATSEAAGEPEAVQGMPLPKPRPAVIARLESPWKTKAEADSRAKGQARAEKEREREALLAKVTPPEASPEREPLAEDPVKVVRLVQPEPKRARREAKRSLRDFDAASLGIDGWAGRNAASLARMLETVSHDSDRVLVSGGSLSRNADGFSLDELVGKAMQDGGNPVRLDKVLEAARQRQALADRLDGNPRRALISESSNW